MFDIALKFAHEFLTLDHISVQIGIKKTLY